MSTELAARLLAAIEEREARIKRVREWMGPLFQVVERTERGAEVKGRPCWIEIAGERVWDADIELRRCTADRRIVERWLVDTANPYEGKSDNELHERRAHPAYEYATTEGQRKAWDDAEVPPRDEATGEPGVGWEPNATAANPRAWERFDYTEESYWRRLRTDGPAVWTRHVPFHIEQLADYYALKVAAVGRGHEAAVPVDFIEYDEWCLTGQPPNFPAYDFTTSDPDHIKAIRWLAAKAAENGWTEVHLTRRHVKVERTAWTEDGGDAWRQWGEGDRR